MLTKFFSTVRQKIFDGKTWYPLVCIKFFDTLNFLKHLRDAHEIFRHCETKNFRRKLVICPLLSINFFRYQKISGKQKGSFTKLFVSVLWDKKFRQNRDAPLLCMKIFDERIFLKHQSVLQWNISIQWDKTDGKSWFPPLIQTFPIPEIIATVKDSPTKIFGTETKNFRRKILIHPPPPSFIQIFSGPEVSETLKDSPTKFFGTVRQKNFDRKSWNSPPPSYP